MKYNSDYKEEHIRYINRRNEIQRNIRRKIDRQYDPSYIMLMRLKKAFATFVLFAAITLTFSLSSSFTTNAKSNHEEKKLSKYYTTVEVKNGDTLTSIAKEYYCYTEYKNLDDYMLEIMELNRLESSTIHSGCYLKIAYFK